MFQTIMKIQVETMNFQIFFLSFHSFFIVPRICKWNLLNPFNPASVITFPINIIKENIFYLSLFFCNDVCAFLLFDVVIYRPAEYSNARRESCYDVCFIILPLLQWRTKGRFKKVKIQQTKFFFLVSTLHIFFVHKISWLVKTSSENLLSKIASTINYDKIVFYFGELFQTTAGK